MNVSNGGGLTSPAMSPEASARSEVKNVGARLYGLR